MEYLKYLKIPIYVPCEEVTAKHYDRMWNTSKKGKKEKQKIRSSTVRTISNAVKIPGYV